MLDKDAAYVSPESRGTPCNTCVLKQIAGLAVAQILHNKLVESCRDVEGTVSVFGCSLVGVKQKLTALLGQHQVVHTVLEFLRKAANNLHGCVVQSLWLNVRVQADQQTVNDGQRRTAGIPPRNDGVPVNVGGRLLISRSLRLVNLLECGETLRHFLLESLAVRIDLA